MSIVTWMDNTETMHEEIVHSELDRLRLVGVINRSENLTLIYEGDSLD